MESPKCAHLSKTLLVSGGVRLLLRFRSDKRIHAWPAGSEQPLYIVTYLRPRYFIYNCMLDTFCEQSLLAVLSHIVGTCGFLVLLYNAVLQRLTGYCYGSTLPRRYGCTGQLSNSCSHYCWFNSCCQVCDFLEASVRFSHYLWQGNARQLLNGACNCKQESIMSSI